MNIKKAAALFLAAAMLTAFSSCEKEAEGSDKTEDNSGTSSAASVSDGKDRVYIEDNAFYVNGKEIWFNGANTPWDKWNDFGGGYNAEFWDTHFAELEAVGINASRVWINCNGLVGVKINEDGSFGSVTDKHWSDLDSLFEIAEKHGIYIMATLLSFDHFKDSNPGYKNWRNMITSSENIDGFVNGYVIPFVQRYDSNDYLFSIDIMNEPDWVHENAECGQLKWENISDLFARCAAGIHENSDVLVTVGMGVIKYNSDDYEGNFVSDEYLQNLSGNKNSYLDFYSPHYYNWERPWFGYPFDSTPEGFKLDGTKPAVIGECSVADETNVPLAERYEGAYNNGWKGAFAWTSNGIDGNGGFEKLKPAAEHMLEIAKDKIDIKNEE